MSHWRCPAKVARDNGDEIAGPFQPLPILHQWWQTTSHWKNMVMGPDSDAYYPTDPPGEAYGAGIYMLFSANEGLLYVGKAGDIANRILAHYRKRRYGEGIPFAHFAFLPVPDYALSDVEIAHIYALKPPYNKLFERCQWAQHGEMVSRIQTAWEENRCKT